MPSLRPLIPAGRGELEFRGNSPTLARHLFHGETITPVGNDPFR